MVMSQLLSDDLSRAVKEVVGWGLCLGDGRRNKGTTEAAMDDLMGDFSVGNKCISSC